MYLCRGLFISLTCCHTTPPAGSRFGVTSEASESFSYVCDVNLPRVTNVPSAPFACRLSDSDDRCDWNWTRSPEPEVLWPVRRSANKLRRQSCRWPFEAPCHRSCPTRTQTISSSITYTNSLVYQSRLFSTRGPLLVPSQTMGWGPVPQDRCMSLCIVPDQQSALQSFYRIYTNDAHEMSTALPFA